MPSSVLVGFGDSWAYGAELDLATEKCYNTIIADHFGWTSLNLAVCSSSIGHLVWQFQDFIQNHWHPDNCYHAVFFLTAMERVTYFDHNNYAQMHHGHPFDPHPQAKAFYRFYNEPYGQWMANRDILALQGLCKAYSITDYWMMGWQVLDLWPTINKSRFFVNATGRAMPISTLFTQGEVVPIANLVSPITPNPFVWPNQGHPNQLGHQTIADAMIAMIKNHVH